MKTIHLFKVSEDSKKFDIVEFIFDELEQIYIVRWKWSCMTCAHEARFTSFEEARQKYKERKNFAKLCN